MSDTPTLQRLLVEHLDWSRLDTHSAHVCRHLCACHTPALGGLVWQCDACEEEQRWYHGCRDRHCPACQGHATRRWAEARRVDVLPVNYHHLVFTLPHDLNGWISLHPKQLYQLLFACVWQTLKAFGENPKRLGGQLGMTAVLHTWGQNLTRHVHLHCLIPGGAVRADGRWAKSKSDYLFPVKALSRKFRGAMVAALRSAHTAGELHRVTRPGEVDKLLNTLMSKPWVVYAKPCLGHTETVVDYLARYSHRIGLHNSRLLPAEPGKVRLSYKDYADHNRHKVLNLSGEELVRRYLLHIVPRGLARIRHFGFLANRCRKAKLAQIREVLAQPEPEPAAKGQGERTQVYPCPECQHGHLHPIGRIAPDFVERALIGDGRR